MSNDQRQPIKASIDNVLLILRDYWQYILVGVLFVVSQWPIFADWYAVWDEPDSYYSHGPLVPFIAAFMIWTNKRKLAKAGIHPSWWGLLLLIVTLPIHSIAVFMELRVLYMASFFGFLYGLILLMFGWRTLKITFVPVLFLITMIPFATWAIDKYTGNAQVISAAVAEKIFTITGYEVTRSGNNIHSNSLPQNLLVGSPCSGLRLLISLITFSWFFNYVIYGKWWKKLILFLCVPPLAVIINSIRIAMIGYAGFWTESAEAMKACHDHYSGPIGLVLCFVILFAIARVLGMRDFTFSLESDMAEQASNRPQLGQRSMSRFAVAVVLLGFCGYVSNMVTPLYDLPKGNLHRENIPKKFGNWISVELPIDDNTKEILNKGDLASILYTNTVTNRQVNVFLDASLDTMAFHDPNLCLPGSGSSISDSKITTLKFDKPYKTSIKASVFNAESDYMTGIVLHWYMLRKDSYPLTGDVSTARRINIANDLKKLISNPFSANELRKEVKQRQFIWYRFSTDGFGNLNEDYKALEDFIKEFVANKKDFGK